MQHIKICLALLLLSLPACGVAVDPTPEPPACPPMACGWVVDAAANTESCSAPFAFGSAQRFESIDDGATACWFYDSVCVTPAPAECVPQECRRVHVTCQVNPSQP